MVNQERCLAVPLLFYNDIKNQGQIEKWNVGNGRQKGFIFPGRDKAEGYLCFNLGKVAEPGIQSGAETCSAELPAPESAGQLLHRSARLSFLIVRIQADGRSDGGTGFSYRQTVQENAVIFDSFLDRYRNVLSCQVLSFVENQ